MDISETVAVPGHEFTIPVKVFQKMCLRHAHHYELSKVESWDDLDGNLVSMFLSMDYIRVVAPLIYHDRNESKRSWKQISNQYLIPPTSIRDIERRVNEILAENRKIM